MRIAAASPRTSQKITGVAVFRFCSMVRRLERGPDTTLFASDLAPLTSDVAGVMGSALDTATSGALLPSVIEVILPISATRKP